MKFFCLLLFLFDVGITPEAEQYDFYSEAQFQESPAFSSTSTFRERVLTETSFIIHLEVCLWKVLTACHFLVVCFCCVCVCVCDGFLELSLSDRKDKVLQARPMRVKKPASEGDGQSIEPVLCSEGVDPLYALSVHAVSGSVCVFVFVFVFVFVCECV